MNPALALYIHWPFCLSKCPYCDFNSHVAEAVDQKRWRHALLAEVAHFAAETPGRTISSVFFGGGTPSLMEPATVAALIGAADKHWSMADDVEITLEANPTSVEAGRFRELAAAGVNRLSLGVQSLDDEALAFLGRGHSAAEARRAMDLGREMFRRFSFDLIYARPDQAGGQAGAGWRRELGQALALATDHVSLYQLTIEPGTPFFRDRVNGADEDTGADLYHLTQEMTEEAGLPSYEVSNHARPGAECRHNMTYWQGGDYLGIGPGAHGRLGRKDPDLQDQDGENDSGFETEAVHQMSRPDKWLAAVEGKGHGTAKRVTLGRRARRQEILLMGLRLTKGVERQRFRALTGMDLTAAVDGKGLERMVDGGFLEIDATGIRATKEGRLRLDSVIATLVP